MDINFTAALVIGVVALGAIALTDRLTSNKQHPQRHLASSALRACATYARSLLPIIVLVLLIRSFVFEPFRIPSGSMMPGLVDGDFVLVDKFSYGLRVPLSYTKIVRTGEPHRGDVVVFRLPSDPSVDFIKRLVGLPGDHVVVQDNRVSINGVLMPVRPAGVYSGDFGFHGSVLETETFPRNAHVIMLASERWATDFSATVPAGEYFFMGDNRNDSEDSRFPQVGFVPEANLVGHAVLIWMNWRVPGWPNLARIGRRIQ